jgi:hypothetical protein
LCACVQVALFRFSNPTKETEPSMGSIETTLQKAYESESWPTELGELGVKAYLRTDEVTYEKSKEQGLMAPANRVVDKPLTPKNGSEDDDSVM